MGMVATDCKGGTTGTDEIQHNILAERVLLIEIESGIDTGLLKDVSKNVSGFHEGLYCPGQHG